MKRLRSTNFESHYKGITVDQKNNLIILRMVVGTIVMCSTFIAVAGSGSSSLPTEPTPYLSDAELPPRTAPILELGGDFLGTGNIDPGFQIPTGAVWQPRLWVYGNFRSGIQRNDLGRSKDSADWANRLDLFGNLQLTGTERLLIGITPLHDDSEFSGRIISPDSDEGTVDELNLNISTLFFEGDIAELFPMWDVNDFTPNDIGFSVGRQNVQFQSGMVMNDTIDTVGISKNNIRIPGFARLVNARATFLYGWNGIHRDDNNDDDGAELYGMFLQADTFHRTMNMDVVYIDSDLNGDVIVAALDSIQTIGKMAATFRVATSHAIGQETRNASDGQLLFASLAWVPHYTHDNVYLAGFAAFDDYVSAARDPLVGGALGDTGILFAGRGLGRYPAALNNRTSNAYGVALGRQFFFSNDRRQVILEAGARHDEDGILNDSYGVGVRLQQAFGWRTIFQVDGFVVDRTDSGNPKTGVRFEVQVKL
jgi:hypothetical protein